MLVRTVIQTVIKWSQVVQQSHPRIHTQSTTIAVKTANRRASSRALAAVCDENIGRVVPILCIDWPILFPL